MALVSSLFNVNIYNMMFSWNGAFFLVRGASILYDNSQIADVKLFLWKHFSNSPNRELYMDTWLPVWMAGEMFLLALISELYKQMVAKRNFKIQQHPYYAI